MSIIANAGTFIAVFPHYILLPLLIIIYLVLFFRLWVGLTEKQISGRWKKFLIVLYTLPLIIMISDILFFHFFTESIIVDYGSASIGMARIGHFFYITWIFIIILLLLMAIIRLCKKWMETKYPLAYNYLTSIIYIFLWTLSLYFFFYQSFIFASLFIFVVTVIITIRQFREKGRLKNFPVINTVNMALLSVLWFFSSIVLIILLQGGSLFLWYDSGFGRCEQNLKELATGVEQYYTDNSKYPDSLQELEGKYLKKVPVCTNLPGEEPFSSKYFWEKFYDIKYSTSVYTYIHTAENYTICCQRGHPKWWTKPGYPRYSPTEGLNMGFGQ
ncbi:MAG TPA: hypothetical protein PL110_21565 [Candidatus Eremiobacteraeota bacterium]|nr:MAG: hypothetical protein BWY64_03907 [bacterium ADurb.Bin363]HPZ10693.1 hypothetical protein [Candidatus Eremiobacteraeota bacterium]